MDLSIFLTAQAWISLVTLLFLEIVLGVDNIVFISITSNRLPREKQHLGRKLGLAGALLMRICFLTVASYLASMKEPLFVLDLGGFPFAVSIHDLIMFFGGAYLIYKGISELADTLKLTELKEIKEENPAGYHTLTLPRAVGTIMVMDIVFSIDSVITAVGLVDYLIIMILAVMIAIFIMMLFIDAIANFINEHVEMKILALCFIAVIGVLLLLEGLHINSGIEVLDMHVEKLMVYFAMVFSVIIALIQIRYNKNYHEWHKQQIEAVAADREMADRFARDIDEALSFDADSGQDGLQAADPDPDPEGFAAMSVDGGIGQESRIIEHNRKDSKELIDLDRERSRNR